MSKDISPVLEGWAFDPEDISVRVVRGNDGREKIQLRLDMGLLQMEVDGRPDGQRPEGAESWLEVYERRKKRHEAQHPDGPKFELNEEDCALLWREGVQYYHRYLSLWHLQRYNLCARDTKRNLRLFAFAKAHAKGERAKFQFDQWRPYVTMMHARSVAMPLVGQGKLARALEVVEAGIDAIRDFLDEYEQTDRTRECVELVHLEKWRDELVREMTRTAKGRSPESVEALKRRLRDAVAAERYEEAARLRDEIRRMDETK